MSMGRACNQFALYFDDALQRPAPYHGSGAYFRHARDRMDRTFEQIRPYVHGATMLDVGASPFYLLYRARVSGAKQCRGIFFANDAHPLKQCDVIYSHAGPIEITHANVETEQFPFDDDEVDVLTACEILEHFDNFPVNFAKEVRRVLRPGGHLCITVPNVARLGNIIKLLTQRNVYMKYRADSTGRHKHEYTRSQLREFVRYLGMEVLDLGFIPSPSSDIATWRAAYRAMARLPFLKSYSPVLYVLARQPDPKPANSLEVPPATLFDASRSIEE
jgi:ubiquinone/menaquinone biosynthesis C-methylase UbiE